SRGLPGRYCTFNRSPCGLTRRGDLTLKPTHYPIVRLLGSIGIILLLSVGAFPKTQMKRKVAQSAKVFLREGWSIQSSAEVKEKGEVLSQHVFEQKKWYPAAVPSTVVGTLFATKLYTSMLVSMNRRLITLC